MILYRTAEFFKQGKSKFSLDKVSATVVSNTDLNVNDHSNSKITLDQISATTVSKTDFNVNDHSKSKVTLD